MSDFAAIYTKLSPPHNLSHAMARERLISIDKLISGENQVVTVIAPAGYGKSTLLAQWQQQLADQKIHNGWLSIDENDNAQVRFVEYLVAALQQLSPMIGEHAVYMLQSGVVSEFGDLFDSLLTDIWALEQEGVLFIDDAHLLGNKDTLQLLSGLLQQLPPTICFVIAGRTYPDLGMSRLKVQSQLLEYGIEEIRFSPEEVSQFICQYKHLDLNENTINMLSSRTEGWAVALQLSSLALSEIKEKAEFVNCLSGRDKDITDYLGDVVLDQQSDEIRHFLLCTSILDRMCSELCDALIDKKNSQQILEKIESENLFLIPLDRERKWYRCHHLFGEYLRHQLQKRYPDHLSNIYKKACQWCSAHDLQNEAIHYALVGKNYDQAGQLLSNYALELIKAHGNHESMVRWMDVLPEEHLNKFPIIRLSYILSLVFTNYHEKYNEQLDWFNDYLKSYEQDSNNPQIKFIKAYFDSAVMMYEGFNGRFFVCRKMLNQWFKEFSGSVDNYIFTLCNNLAAYCMPMSYEFEEGIALTEKGSAIFKQMGLHYSFTWPAVIHLSLLISKGDLATAKQSYENALAFAKEGLLPNQFGCIMLGFHFAEVEYEQGEIKASLNHIQPNLYLLDKHGMYLTDLTAYRTLMRIFLYNNDMDAANNFLQKIGKLILPRDWHYMIYVLVGEMLRYYFVRKEIALATTLINEYNLLSEKTHQKIRDEILSHRFKRLAFLTHIRLDEAHGHYLAALNKLNNLIEQVKPLKSKYELIPLLLVKAKLLYQCGKINQAGEIFCESLTLGQKDEYIQVFIEEGEIIKKLLLSVFNSSFYIDNKISMKTYIEKLLESFKMHEMLSQSVKRLSHVEKKPELTGRELSIVKLLHTEMTHQQIADRLKISINTLKWNLRNTYRKLNVRNRTGAIAFAKGEGIIDY